MSHINESYRIYQWFTPRNTSHMTEELRYGVMSEPYSKKKRLKANVLMTKEDGSCHVRMRYFIHKGVMSHVNESCPTWMSHVPYEWVMSHMNESRMDESCHVWMSHVTLMRHVARQFMYDWVLPFVVWTICVLDYNFNKKHIYSLAGKCFLIASVNESCAMGISPFTHEFVKSHMNVSHRTAFHT